MLNYLKILFIISLFAIVSLNFVYAQDQEDLLSYIPHLEGLTAKDVPQKIRDNEGLFAFINGGAEPYVQNGFYRALFQTFKTRENKLMNLEITEMKDEDGAHKIYALKAGSECRAIEVGDEAVLGDYYLIFRKGRFFVSLTGFDSEKQTKDALVAFAKALDKKL
jgi:hypothetical protein